MLYLKVICLLLFNTCVGEAIIGYSKQYALHDFGSCLRENRNQLEIRDLNDLYRIRSIPAKCCQSLAEEIIPESNQSSTAVLDVGNCRVNAYFIKDGIFDPHNHPLYFTSYLVAGGYTHTIFSKEDHYNNANGICTANENQVCAEYSKIDTKTDTIQDLGTVKLKKLYKESFVKGNYIEFNDTKMIHEINSFESNTLSVNFLSDVGDNEIDVFISHTTPNRKVLSKADTRTPVDKLTASEVINKSINILQNNDGEAA